MFVFNEDRITLANYDQSKNHVNSTNISELCAKLYSKNIKSKIVAVVILINETNRFKTQIIHEPFVIQWLYTTITDKNIDTNDNLQNLLLCSSISLFHNLMDGIQFNNSMVVCRIIYTIMNLININVKGNKLYMAFFIALCNKIKMSRQITISVILSSPDVKQMIQTIRDYHKNIQ